jgi:hypothetical protein
VDILKCARICTGARLTRMRGWCVCMQEAAHAVRAAAPRLPTGRHPVTDHANTLHYHAVYGYFSLIT